MIKLIASDLDGTLLDKKQKISPVNVSAIKKAMAKGIRFMISSGRNYDTIEPMFSEYGFRCACLLQNGAEIRDEQGTVLSAISMKPEDVIRCTEILNSYSLLSEYMTNQGVYTIYPKEQAFSFMVDRMHCLRPDLSRAELEKMVPETVFFQKLHYADGLESLFERKLEVRKIITFHDDPQLCSKVRAELEEKVDICALSSFPINIEINHKQAQKGIALKRIIEKMGILPEEVVVFGDGLNDKTLFTEFTQSYAPENAEPEIKAMAKEIIGYHYEDAVGKKILELIG